MAAQIVDAAFVRSRIGKMSIIDVRPAEMYEQGHIPTALNIPLADIEQLPVDAQAEALSKKFRLHALATEDPLIVYCQIGKHAKQCCDLVEAQGYQNLYLYSGSFADWTSDLSNPIEQ